MHKNREELLKGLEHIRQSPKDRGVLHMIVRRPAENQREVLNEGKLDLKYGLKGDNWIERSSSRTGDGSAHPDMQINIMNSRVIDLLAGLRDRWQLAGDQLYMDLDLSLKNLPPGTELQIGEARLMVTEQPHTGCKKFVERFGLDAMKFVNDKEYRHLNLRGINAKVIKPGLIRTHDTVLKK